MSIVQADRLDTIRQHIETGILPKVRNATYEGETSAFVTARDQAAAKLEEAVSLIDAASQAARP